MINRRDLYFVVVILVVVGILTYLSLTGKEKFIARIEPHLAVAGVKDAAQADAVCLSCHGSDVPREARVANAPPMPENHPLRKKNCRQCHRLERKKP